MERLYWINPASFLIEKELEPFFEEALTQGYHPFRNAIDGKMIMSGFGVSAGHREAFFINRGRDCRGSRGLLWEVLLRDAERWIRLGPFFGLHDHACIVVSGIEAIRVVCFCYLAGGDTNEVTSIAEFINRKSMVALSPTKPPANAD